MRSGSLVPRRVSGLDKKHLAIINIIFAIGDVIVCLAFVPLLLYNSHGIIIDTQNAQNTQKEVDGNGKP